MARLVGRSAREAVVVEGASVRGRPSGIGASAADHYLAGHPAPATRPGSGRRQWIRQGLGVPLVAQVAVRYRLVDLAVVESSIEEVIAASTGAPYRRPGNCVFGCVGV